MKTIVVVLLAMASSCVAAMRDRPNVLLIVVDTLRADHVGALGYKPATTPNIDALAREGVLFTQCYSTSSWTLPACASVLTGLYPSAHGGSDWKSVLIPEMTTLAEVLSESGYCCRAVTSNPFLTAQQGFAQGFETFDDTTVLAAAEWSFPLEKSPFRSIVQASTSATTTRRAIELLNDLPGDKPFFLLVHYMDCHADYVPPPPYDRQFDPHYEGEVTGQVQSKRLGADLPARDVRRIVSLYDGEIAWTDHHVGMLLEHLAALELAEGTCVVLLADHGEELLDHGQWGHGSTLEDEVVRVPLILRWRGLKDRRPCETPVSLADVAPTVAGICGVKFPAPVQGIDLLGESKQRPGPILLETSLGKPLTGLVKPDGRKVVAPPADSPDARALEQALQASRQLGRKLRPGEGGSTTRPSSEQTQRLRSLGYIGG